MGTQFLKARQTKYAAYAAIYVLVVIAIIATANNDGTYDELAKYLRRRKIR